MKRIKLRYLVYIFIFLLVGVVFADILTSGTRVNEGSEVTYYISTSYDGLDRYGIYSSDEQLAYVYSDYIEVEDEIPNGLEFVGFVTSYNGTIGAVRRNDNSLYCKKFIFVILGL